MSAQATQADDGTDDEITDFDQLHGKLSKKLNKLQRITPDNYEMTVEVSSELYDTVSVVIDSDDWIFNEGEIGDMHFHVILGPQGGLQIASYDRTLCGGGDCVEQHDSKERAWKSLCRRVKGAK